MNSLGKSSPNTSSRQSKSSLILSSDIPTSPPKVNNLSLIKARKSASCTNSVNSSQSSCNEAGPPSFSIASIKASNSSSSDRTVVKHSSHVGGSGSPPTTILLLLFIHTILEFLLESDCLSLPSSLSSYYFRWN